MPCSIQVKFFDEKDGTEKTVTVPLGQSLLEAAHENEIDLEGASEPRLQRVASDQFWDCRTKPECVCLHACQLVTLWWYAGACEGSLACSTCHVVVVVRSRNQPCWLTVN